jgi:hypothetical protein
MHARLNQQLQQQHQDALLKIKNLFRKINKLSNAPIATLKPLPGEPKTFSFGTCTLSKVIVLVSEHRCPTFNSFFPRETPFESPSTIKAVNAFPADAFKIKIIQKK